jgi:parallel beta-helix repeat protein
MIYYFSTSDGDDSRTSIQAQNSATPWQTLAKLNSFFPSLLPGDQVLFKKGDTFYGSITATKSGTAGSPITFGAYSTGADPIITGLFDVPAWTNISGNIWESTAAVSALSSLNMVLVGGVFTPIGRWPNSGYNTIASHTGGDNAAGTAASITSGSSLPADFTGGEVVIRKRHWIIDRATITSQVGDTLNHINPSIYGSLDGWGYFVQNHMNCLDSANDWLYDSGSKKIRIVSSGSPSAVKVSSIDTLVVIGTQAYLTFSGLQFDGSNSQHFSVSSGNNLIFTGCTFRYAGINIFTTQSAAHHISVLTNTVSRTNNNFITSNRAQNWVIMGNDIEDTAQVAGMGQSRDGNYEGMNAIGANSIIQYNTLLRTGYLGIEFVGGGVQVRNNFVDTFCNIKDDGAGIYTYTGPAATVYTQRIVDHNIVINGGGASDGTNTSNEDAFGIYMDDNSSNVTISNNTVANCGAAGLYFHASHDIAATGNTIYNCALTAHAQFLEVFPGATSTAAVRNLKLTGNKFISRESTQRVARMTTSEANMSQWPLGLTNANYNGNYYARPVNEDATTFQLVTAGGTTNTDLPGWTAASGALLDNTSNISPITLASPTDIRFEYNATNAPVTVSLGADNYIDVAGIGYTGDISLGAWESLVLFLTDAPPPPPTAISQIIIDFTPCAEMPVEGYQILYRVVGDTAYIDAGFFTTSPAVIAVDYPAGTLFEGVIRSDCGDVPWAGGGGSGGGGCAPVSVFSVTLPNGETGDPYSYSVPLDPAWTTPIDLTVITAPSWMTIAIVGTDIVFSGTPDAEETVDVQFTLENDCGSVEIDTTITVASECIPIGIIEFSPDEGILGAPYEFRIPMNPIDATPPFIINVTDAPSWLVVSIDPDTNEIVLSGTPDAIVDNASLNFTITNCIDGLSETGTFISVGTDAVVNAGDDNYVCSGSTYTLAGTSANVDNVQWTTDGDGTFDDDTSLTAVYTPGTGDVGTLVTLTLTGYVSGVPVATDTVQIIVLNSAPVATFDYTNPNASSQYCRCEPSNPSCVGNPISPNFTGGGQGGLFDAITPGLLFFDSGASPSGTGQVDIANTPAGTYTVRNTIDNICLDNPIEETATITILALPVEGYTWSTDNVMTVGEGLVNVVISPIDGSVFSRVYNAPAGLVINASTGQIDCGASTPGTYLITIVYTSFTCPNSAQVTVTINP